MVRQMTSTRATWSKLSKLSTWSGARDGSQQIGFQGVLGIAPKIEFGTWNSGKLKLLVFFLGLIILYKFHGVQTAKNGSKPTMLLYWINLGGSKTEAKV